MVEVNVDLHEHSYTIHIAAGSICQAGELLRTLSLGNKVLIVTDDNVGPLYADQLVNSLKAAGFNPHVLAVRPGESSKSLVTANLVFTEAINNGIDRNCAIIALGGGVIGDLAGFVAANYLRGVPFIQVPTTLLAQVDSSVGGKTAVNHELGKNLIGAFYQPRMVIIDPQTLQTLNDRELKAGIAEIIKYGVIADPEFFAYLEVNAMALLARNPEVLTTVIGKCCQIKADIVARDERESSLRMILNFGHTIGHAIEAEGGYFEYNHGEGVAIGMHAAALISQNTGLCEQSQVTALTKLIAAFGLPLAAPRYHPDKLLSFLARDKKVLNGKINWILMDKIGHVTITNEVTEENITCALRQIT